MWSTKIIKNNEQQTKWNNNTNVRQQRYLFLFWYIIMVYYYYVLLLLWNLKLNNKQNIDKAMIKNSKYALPQHSLQLIALYTVLLLL